MDTRELYGVGKKYLGTNTSQKNHLAISFLSFSQQEMARTCWKSSQYFHLSLLRRLPGAIRFKRSWGIESLGLQDCLLLGLLSLRVVFAPRVLGIHHIANALNTTQYGRYASYATSAPLHTHCCGTETRNKIHINDTSSSIHRKHTGNIRVVVCYLSIYLVCWMCDIALKFYSDKGSVKNTTRWKKIFVLRFGRTELPLATFIIAKQRRLCIGEVDITRAVQSIAYRLLHEYSNTECTGSSHVM